jgi:ParB family chromosome partitioning protein
MARKHLFEIAKSEPVPAEPQAQPQPQQPARPLMGLSLTPSTPVGAISQSLEAINSRASRAEEIERKLSQGQSVVELDPSVIDSAIVIDRLGIDPEHQNALIQQIRENGQLVPILVRPHPQVQGRYQLAYGHRRLAALRALGLQARAVVRELSDEQLVVSQGQENNSRQDLSYVERCYFALRLEEKGFSRDIIMSALGVDKAALSRMIALVKRVPADIIEAIGSAPSIGRQKWAELADLMEDRSKRTRLAKLITEEKFTALPSDERFNAAIKALTDAKEKASATSWQATDGTKPVTISENDRRLVMNFDKRVNPKFGSFIEQRLQALYDEFRDMNTKEH